jgi:putative restriction endonuclease
VRSACFAALDVLQAKWGPDVPYSALTEGFAFRGRRVPFLNRAYGIYRARAQRGQAALSLNSSFLQQRYQDEQSPTGIVYRYQDGPVDNHFNRWLRNAHLLRVPLVYFVGTRQNWYRPEYPTFVEEDQLPERRVLLTFGEMRGPYDEREPVHFEDELDRRYALRQVRQRIHQAQFRGIVLPAYREQCTICRLRETRLLDTAHIIGEAVQGGEPMVANGLSLCSIHHRAFDQDLVGVAPDYKVHVAKHLLDEEDGPMLDVLKKSDGHDYRRTRAASVATRPRATGDPIRTVSERGVNRRRKQGDLRPRDRRRARSGTRSCGPLAHRQDPAHGIDHSACSLQRAAPLVESRRAARSR